MNQEVYTTVISKQDLKELISPIRDIADFYENLTISNHKENIIEKYNLSSDVSIDVDVVKEYRVETMDYLITYTYTWN